MGCRWGVCFEEVGKVVIGVCDCDDKYFGGVG